MTGRGRPEVGLPAPVRPAGRHRHRVRTPPARHRGDRRGPPRRVRPPRSPSPTSAGSSWRPRSATRSGVGVRLAAEARPRRPWRTRHRPVRTAVAVSWSPGPGRSSSTRGPRPADVSRGRRRDPGRPAAPRHGGQRGRTGGRRDRVARPRRSRRRCRYRSGVRSPSRVSPASRSVPASGSRRSWIGPNGPRRRPREPHGADSAGDDGSTRRGRGTGRLGPRGRPVRGPVVRSGRRRLTPAGPGRSHRATGTDVSAVTPDA